MGEGASLEQPSKMDDPEKGSKDVISVLIGNELTDLPGQNQAVLVRDSKYKNERSKKTKTGRSYEHLHSGSKGQMF